MGLSDEQRTDVATVRITDSDGAVLAYFDVSDPILSAAEIAAYLEAEANERFDAEAL